MFLAVFFLLSSGGERQKLGRKAVESIGLILTIVGPLNGSDAVTAYLY